MHIRNDFPFFRNHPELAYLDSAATTQKPQAVIDALVHFYASDNAPVHRGIYQLAEKATEQYEAVRAQVARFIGAQPEEIVFTGSATHGINMVARGWAAPLLQAGDEIVLTELEHHANLVVWQQLAQQVGAFLRFIPVDESLQLECASLEHIITSRTKLVAMSGSSNIVGPLSPIAGKKIIERARAVGAQVLLDAAQMVAHQKINVDELDIDFLVFSGHKLLGPTGVGVLYVRRSLHAQMQPVFYGGSMVFEAGYETSRWRAFPYNFEAGTMPVAQVIGLGAALRYIEDTLSFDDLQAYEAQLCALLLDELKPLAAVHIVGDEQALRAHGHMVTFRVDGIHPHDVAAYADRLGICIRAGHQCAQPIHKKQGYEGSVRASFYGYNTVAEVELLAQMVKALV